MTDAEIRDALARAERATPGEARIIRRSQWSDTVEIGDASVPGSAHAQWTSHMPSADLDFWISARTDVPRLAADLLAARAERDEQARIADHNLAAWKQAMDAAKSALDERDEALAFLRDFLHTTSGKKSLDEAPLSRLESAAQILLSPQPPHTCQIHRATSGASDCGLSPCEEATVHRDRGEARSAENATPEAVKCATCGGEGGVSRIEAVGHDEYGDLVGEAVSEPCPDCHGCGGAK